MFESRSHPRLLALSLLISLTAAVPPPQTIHHPSPSLSIAGDLKDLKLKSSVAHLLHVLQHDANANAKSGGRRLSYGSSSEIPSPITISSQAIKINANQTKKPRNILTELDLDDKNIRTIEGVRVPDDPLDKFQTWRNARVIKGFLVPNGREANPHKKRQVVAISTDPNAYAAAAAAARASGATALVAAAGNNGPNNEQVLTAANYYNQAQQQPVSQQYTTGQIPNQDSSPVYFSSRAGEVNSQPNSQQQNQQQIIAQALQQAQALQLQQAQAQLFQAQFYQQQQAQAQAQAQAFAQSEKSVNSDPQSQGIQYIVQTAAQAQPQSQAQAQAQAYQFYQQQFAERSGQPQAQAQVPQQQAQATQAQPNFVIQPQTYVSGGQTFTIPIPIPADQAQAQAQAQVQASNRQEWYKRPPHAHAQSQFQTNPNSRPNHSHIQNPSHNIANRVMDAWAHNKKALERIDTSTAVVPALASTGIFLGLSALAAGWYLSKGNREVGIVRRTGRPSRAKRDVGINNNGNGLVNAYPQEVDQATFFQSIIQQSLEKTQQQYEDQLGANSNSEPVYNNEPQYSNNREVEQQPQSRPKNSRVSNHRDRPQNRDDSDYYNSRPSSKYAQEKSGPLTVASSKNFAKVFIPALILGVSVLAITGLIFGWYITGANREIAFLEPSSYSRKKRSLSPLSDGGWLHRTISALHKNPYDRIPAPTSKSLLPHPFMETETSKTSDLEFKISNSGITGVLAGGALIAIMALGLANSFGGSESRGLKGGKKLGQGLPGQIVRAPRSLAGNGLEDEEGGLMSSVYSAIDGVQGLLEGLHSVGLFDPREQCSKKLVCELLKDEDDETVRHTERRVEAFINILPPSLSKPLSEVLGQIVTSVTARDCSAFSCQSNNNSHHTFGNVSIKKLK